MNKSSPPASYNGIAKLLHWSTATLVFINLAVGLHMEHFPGYKHGTTDWNSVLFYHASFGSLVFWLTLFRFSWSASHIAPQMPSMPHWQKLAAISVHSLLYGILLTLPFTGYLHRMAGGHAVSFWGLFNWPVIINKSEPFRLLTGNLHITLAFLLMGLITIHLLAVLKHTVVDRDNLLKRMSFKKDRV